MIQTILVMIATTAIFYFGFLLGYKTSNKEEISKQVNIKDIKQKIPFTKANRELKEEIQEEEQEINRLNTLLHNITVYKGDDEGQRRIN